jgi:hypothetical protein
MFKEELVPIVLKVFQKIRYTYKLILQGQYFLTPKAVEHYKKKKKKVYGNIPDERRGKNA